VVDATSDLGPVASMVWGPGAPTFLVGMLPSKGIETSTADSCSNEYRVFLSSLIVRKQPSTKSWLPESHCLPPITQ
jgi:hypothetical protein